MGSVILKNIFRFAFRRWDKIPNDELKGYSIYIFFGRFIDWLFIIWFNEGIV